MPKSIFKKGTTSKLIRIFLQSATTGNPITGAVFNSAGLTAYYIKEGDASSTAITLITATLGTWASGGFKEVDATNMPGLYEVGVPNAAIASGNTCTIYLTGYSGMVPVIVELQLDATDNQDAVRYGLSSLPNAAAGATGGLPTATDSSGRILLQPTQTGVTIPTVTTLTNAATISLTQAIPTSNTAQTVGDALNAARAQGFGKWSISGTTLNLYASDGTTVVRAFTLDSSTAPTSRT